MRGDKLNNDSYRRRYKQLLLRSVRRHLQHRAATPKPPDFLIHTLKKLKIVWLALQRDAFAQQSTRVTLPPTWLHSSCKRLYALLTNRVLTPIRWRSRTTSEYSAKNARVLARSASRTTILFEQSSWTQQKLRLMQGFLRAQISTVGRWLWSGFSPFWETVYRFPVQTMLYLSLSASLVGGTFMLHEYIFADLPEATALTTTEPVVSTKILDRNGKVLYRLYDEENRSIVALSKIPTHAILATIAIEDKEFFSHHGFSVRGITRAFFSNLEGESVQGGSTITQQLVKNRLLSSEKTITRKIRELLLAILVERQYSKTEILEMYLNQVAYGGSTYGIEEAAQRYFGKPATKLTLAEAALLAGLPQAPSFYSPYGPNPEHAYNRQKEVLRRMVEDGYISQNEAEQAGQEQLSFKENVIDIQAPHFVMYVKKLLAEQYGESILNQGGLEVRTTLDLELQNEVQALVTTEVDQLKSLKVSNGAALVTNPQTGEVLSMVGSRNYFDFAHDGQVNATIRPRQPGSSIKPLTYAVALQKGYSPATLISDTPVTYHSAGSPPYSPKNYDGRYHGTVTLRESLGSSYNIPAVKTLAHVGLGTVIDAAESMGITTWKDRKRFGLSLTLGGGEVLMTEMAQLYGTFATGGTTMTLDPILEIKTYKGETLYRNTCALEGTNCQGQQTLDERVAYLISHMLADNTARTPAFGPLSTLNIPDQEVAVKTGTTNNLRDNWTFGYTSDRVIAVWVGNFDNTPMSYVASGVTGASSIWNKITRTILSADEPHTFQRPSGIVSLPSCSSRTRECPDCPPVREDLYIVGTQPPAPCAPSQFSRIPETQLGRSRILEGATTQN